MAIGSGSEGAQTALQEHYKPELTLAEAEVLALSTLKQVMEEKVRGAGWGQEIACLFVVGDLTARCSRHKPLALQQLPKGVQSVASSGATLTHYGTPAICCRCCCCCCR
jgi:hypothetical protein